MLRWIGTHQQKTKVVVKNTSSTVVRYDGVAMAVYTGSGTNTGDKSYWGAMCLFGMMMAILLIWGMLKEIWWMSGSGEKA